MAGLLSIASADEFAAKAAAHPLSVVHFQADWAPQCKQVNEVLAELATLHPALQFCLVEAENLPEVSLKYEVAAVPTVVFLQAGRVVGRVNGANVPELSKTVKQLAAKLPSPAVVAAAAPTAPGEDLNTRLKKLVSAAPVMLFMKGNPAEPRCGFSRQTVELLKSQDAEFSSFDILEDDEVRQGLKTFSNWPTFPQLYVNGELVGGLDILKEMAEAGELKSVLPHPLSEAELNEKLKKLITKDKVVLFMKGTADAPRCGFSRTAIQLLRDEKAVFSTYDILGDNEVRQGLKKFSNWPTFPQLYVDGELLGGLDIMKELKEQAELGPSLAGQ